MSKSDLDKEAEQTSAILREKKVSVVHRHRPNEVLIEFEDGTRFFINSRETSIELSITGGERGKKD